MNIFTIDQPVDFSRISPADFKTGFDESMAAGKKIIESILNSRQKPGFDNTIEALEHATYPLKRIEAIFFNLNAAETNPQIQQLAQEYSPILTGFYNDITLNALLFSRIREVYEARDALELNTEQQKLLEETYLAFVRNGAGLATQEKDEYREVTAELSKLTLQFEENLLAETNNFELHIEDAHDLSGLPEFVREAAALEARSRNRKGWVFTLKAPSYQAFMKFADNRVLREKLFLAYSSRCFHQNEHDNREIIRRIVDLRLRVAKLLGHKNYAQYVLEERMARNPETVSRFLQELLEASLPVARRDYAAVQAYMHKIGIGQELQRWDWLYYAEKLKHEKFSYTEQMTKPYFQLDKVQEGIFMLANRLYGLTFRPEENVPVYHPDVRVFRVCDAGGSDLALLYLDFFPRKGKQGGAWMTNYLDQFVLDGRDIRPHVSLVFNFTQPTEVDPSLLTYDEVRTFLHEFGHALHGMCSRCVYQSLSGTHVYRDFVELPSQIMENWAEQRDWIGQVAIHYKTGESIPDTLLDAILKSRNFNSGYASLRQLSFGLNDMAWHTITEPLRLPVTEFEQTAMAATEIFPPVAGVSFSTGFAHIFGGGYAAGYYGYKWAEVLDADAFSLFLERGIFDRKTATAFRTHILERGGTEHPMELYKRFRGKEPTLDALLEREGLKS